MKIIDKELFKLLAICCLSFNFFIAFEIVFTIGYCIDSNGDIVCIPNDVKNLIICAAVSTTLLIGLLISIIKMKINSNKS